MGNCSVSEKGLKDETLCRDNRAYFTSCNVLAGEHRPLPQPALLALFPKLCLWCTQTGVWELYINSWVYLALIKIHKQAKCKFICSSQQNVSLISCVLVIAKEFWMAAFQAKFIGLQIIFPYRKLFSKWIVMLQRFYISTCVFCILHFGVILISREILPYNMAPAFTSTFLAMLVGGWSVHTLVQAEIPQQLPDRLPWNLV